MLTAGKKRVELGQDRGFIFSAGVIRPPALVTRLLLVPSQRREDRGGPHVSSHLVLLAVS